MKIFDESINVFYIAKEEDKVTFNLMDLCLENPESLDGLTNLIEEYQPLFEEDLDKVTNEQPILVLFKVDLDDKLNICVTPRINDALDIEKYKEPIAKLAKQVVEVVAEDFVYFLDNEVFDLDDEE